MGLAKRVKHMFLRWNGVLMAVVLALPFVVAMGLGFLWLYEQTYLLWFAIGSAAFYMSVRVLSFVFRWWAGRRGTLPEQEFAGPDADPDWSAKETEAYDRARRRIIARLEEPIAWDELPAEALAVVETVAADLSNGQRSVLDFSLPEALLLVDRVATRYRSFLLENLPYSDRLSVRNMLWLWRNQGTARAAWETGFLAWRGVRLVLNPVLGAVREAERAMASGLQSELTSGMMRDVQAILLEEAAQAAIDLYSGRLRFTEAELARIAAGQQRDLAPKALAPLRMVVVGQKGAGKSSLIGALRGEVSDDAQTRRAVTHDWALAGVDAVFVDMPGFDGSGAAQKRVLEVMAEADLILWVHRANRPSRAPDSALQAAFLSGVEKTSLSSAPPVIHVATGVDALVAGWPRPEHALTRSDRATIEAAMTSIGAVMGGVKVIPVCAVKPEWNLRELTVEIAARVEDAARAQRHRVVALAEQGASWRDNMARAGRGLRTAWQRFSLRQDETNEDGGHNQK